MAASVVAELVALASGERIDGARELAGTEIGLIPLAAAGRLFFNITQLRYDLRKLKGHGLLQRDGTHYAYRLTRKGLKVALLFVLFHEQLCGPLANSLFHHPPQTNPPHPLSKLEAALHKADTSIHRTIRLLEAA